MAENLTSAEKQEREDNAFDLTKRVSVYSTDKDPYHETGSEMLVGVLVAKKLLANGLATKEPIQTDTKTKGK